MKKLTISVLFLLGLLAGNLQVMNAQEEETTGNTSLDVNVDLVSRYLWRGLLLNPAPNVQPYATLNVGNFSFGGWGSYSLTDYYAEADLFVSYSAGNVTLTVTDYFTTQDTTSDYGYFVWGKDTTLHTLEGMISWTVSEDFPLSLTAGTMFYGYDMDDNGKQLYSTYLEAAYPLTIGESTLGFFAGATPAKGYYHDKAALVHLGCKASRDIKITDNFSMPLSLSFSVNPAAKRAFFVAAITF
ncbi:MAG: hypothetical protein U0T82_09945 [Bacteroidales bacterium]